MYYFGFITSGQNIDIATKRITRVGYRIMIASSADNFKVFITTSY